MHQPGHPVRVSAPDDWRSASAPGSPERGGEPGAERSPAPFQIRGFVRKDEVGQRYCATESDTPPDGAPHTGSCRNHSIRWPTASRRATGLFSFLTTGPPVRRCPDGPPPEGGATGRSPPQARADGACPTPPIPPHFDSRNAASLRPRTRDATLNP